MNRSSRTIGLIEKSLHRLEVAAAAAAEATGADEATAMEALGLLDEIRRLERKWREQVTAGSGRRTDADFATMKGWYRRWLVAADRLLTRGENAPLRRERAEVQKVLDAW